MSTTALPTTTSKPETDHCFGNSAENSPRNITLVDSTPITPCRNTKVASLCASLHYKFSVEVFCDHSLPLNDNLENILHITAGNDYGNIGDRTFAIWRNPSLHSLKLTVTHPDGPPPTYQTHVHCECENKKWTSFVLELKAPVLPNEQQLVEYLVTQDGVRIMAGSYDIERAYKEGPLEVFVSSPWWEVGSKHLVRNFVYEKK